MYFWSPIVAGGEGVELVHSLLVALHLVLCFHYNKS